MWYVRRVLDQFPHAWVQMSVQTDNIGRVTGKRLAIDWLKVRNRAGGLALWGMTGRSGVPVDKQRTIAFRFFRWVTILSRG